MKCKELMVGDFCRSGHGFPMQITNVGDDYAYATFEGNEGDPWEFDDKDYTPEPILLTDDILKRNRFEICGIAIWSSNTDVGCSYRKEIENDFIYCIPYNDDTKHLAGTNENAPEYYRYWEE